VLGGVAQIPRGAPWSAAASSCRFSFPGKIASQLNAIDLVSVHVRMKLANLFRHPVIRSESGADTPQSKALRAAK